MSTRRQIQKRGSLKSSFTPPANPLKTRGFGKGIQARSAELPKTNPLQTRPFGSPIPASAQQEETESASEQLEKASHFGYNGLDVPVNSPEPPPLKEKMPAYTPLDSNWVANNPLMRSLDPTESVWQQNPDAKEVLRIGSTGSAVKYLQNALNKVNTESKQLTPDGIFGLLTHSAVVSFQRSAGIIIDGIVGSQTWGALNKGKQELPVEDKENKVDGKDDSSGNSVDTSHFDKLYAKLTNPDSQISDPGSLWLDLVKEMGLPVAVATPILQFSASFSDKDGGGFDDQYKKQEYFKSVQAILKSIIALQPQTYPQTSKHYKKQPINLDEANERLENKSVKPLSPEEEKWLYQYMQIWGLLELSNAWQAAASKGQNLDPIRAKIVSIALGQVGLVEAHVDSGEERKVGNKTIRVRKGGDRLLEYIQMASPAHASNEVQKRDILDVAIPTGPKGGNRVPSWCGILALWIQNTAGNDGGTWPNTPWMGGKFGPDKLQFRSSQEEPQPGDIAYTTTHHHHATVIRVEGNTVTTVDGNTGEDGASAIRVRSRSKEDWVAFARAVPKGQG